MKESSHFNDSANLLPLPGPNNGEEISDSEIAKRLKPFINKTLRGDRLPAVDEHNIPETKEVLHKVVEAAEKNQPIEKLFELRHEAKDFEPSAIHKATDPSSVGQVLESRAQIYARQSNNAANRQNKTPGLLKQVLKGGSLYGHAIRYGFISALLSLLVAILAVTLFT